MMWECDMLSGYNRTTDDWREGAAAAAVAENEKKHLLEKVVAFEGGRPVKSFLSVPENP